MDLNTPTPAPASRVGSKLHEIFGVDVRSLAALRGMLGAIILVDMALRLPWIGPFYADSGFFPRELLPTHLSPLFPAFMRSGNVEVQLCLVGILAVAAAALLVGYHTRIATFVCWFLWASIQMRNWNLLHGADSVVRMLLFWSLFLPLGARFSLDARRARAPLRESSVLSVASVALLLQFVFLFVVAGIQKIGPEWHVDGTAIGMVMRGDYARHPFADWALHFPGILKVLSLGTVPFEVLVPPLIFFPYRTPYVRMLVFAAYLGFQIGLWFGMTIYLFNYVSFACSLAVLPTLFWEKLEAKWPRLRSPEPGTGDARATPSRRGAGFFVAQATVALFLVYSFLAAFHSVGWMNVNKQIRGVGKLFGQTQHWHLYAPSPPWWDPVFEMPGLLRDGTTLDLQQAHSGEGWNEVPRMLGTFRMRRYLDMRVRPPKPGKTESAYLGWICAQWNATHEGDRRLERVRVLFTQRILREEGGESKRYRLSERACPDE